MYVVEGRQRSLVRDVRHGNAERGLEQLAHEMVERAGAARAVAQWSLLRELHEIGDRMDRERRVDHQHERHMTDQRHQNEVPVGTVRQFLIERLVHRHGPAGGHHDRVAIGCALGDLHCRRDRARAGTVLDHERFAETLGEFLSEQPRQNIGAAAGRERHDERDLAVGILRGAVLGRRRADRCADQREAKQQHARRWHE